MRRSVPFVWLGPVASGLLAILAAATPAVAHEFWLDPVTFTPKAGASVPIVHRTGINFLGDSFPYLRAHAKRYVVIDARGERRVKAVEGDDPASEITLPNAGLAIVVYHSAFDAVTFDGMEKFEFTLKEEGLEHIAQQHRDMGKPLTGIREIYARAAKSLIRVGGGGGKDRAVGLPLEIIVDGDPYALPAGQPLPVRVLHNGKPIAGILLKSFNLADTQSPRRVRTDAEGRATVDLPIAGEYLLAAVHMLPAQPQDKADWMSLWASVTFKRP